MIDEKLRPVREAIVRVDALREAIKIIRTMADEEYEAGRAANEELLCRAIVAIDLKLIQRR